MFSKSYKRNKQFSETGFRYRGIESSRIEHLTDAVFAFAITLLVIASEVPKTYVELQASMYSFIGFIACSLLLLGIWSNHANFFMNYGMRDRKTKILNFLFLFVLLFYIYPLKYLFSHLGNLIIINILGKGQANNEAFLIAYRNAISSQLTVDQWQDLMLRFGLGLLLIYLILVFMHVNALFRKEKLELNKQEVFETKYHILNYSCLCIIAILSMSIVIITKGDGSGISGSVYLLIPIVLTITKKVHYKKLKEKFPLSFNRVATSDENKPRVEEISKKEEITAENNPKVSEPIRKEKIEKVEKVNSNIEAKSQKPSNKKD